MLNIKKGVSFLFIFFATHYLKTSAGINSIQRMPKIPPQVFSEIRFCVEMCEALYDISTKAKTMPVFAAEHPQYKIEFLHEQDITHAMFLIKNEKLYVMFLTIEVGRAWKDLINLLFVVDILFNTIECSAGIINIVKVYFFQFHTQFINLLANNHNIAHIALSGVSIGGIQSQLLGLFYAMLIDFYKNYYKQDIIVPAKLNTLTKSFYKWLHQQNPIKSIEELMDDDYKVFSRIDIENVFAFGAGGIFTQQSAKLYNKYMLNIESIDQSKSFALHNTRDVFSCSGSKGAPYSFFVDLVSFVRSKKWANRHAPGCIAIINDQKDTDIIHRHMHYSYYLDDQYTLSTLGRNNLNLVILPYKICFNKHYTNYKGGLMCGLISLFAESFYAPLIPIILLCNMFGGQYYLHWHQLGLSGIFYGLLIKNIYETQ